MIFSGKPDERTDLSVVIPALEEAPNLRQLLPLLREALNGLGVAWEVLVIDGDSRDGTPEVVRDAGEGFRYICETAKGYGAAIRRGVDESQGAYIMTMDADLSHPVQFVQRLWRARDSGELVIASRYVWGGYANQPWGRLMLSRVLNRFFGWGMSIPARDMSSGFRLYNRRIFQHFSIEHTNFVFLVEVLIKTYGKGFMITEVPFCYEPRDEGVSHARILSFGMDYLRLFRSIWRTRNSVDFADYDWRAHDSRIWLQRYWQRKRHHVIAGFTPPFVSTLDVGCGSSRILASMPQAIGLDLRDDKLRFMRRTNRLLVQGDGMAIAFPDNHFECVISSQVIEHIPEENGQHLDELIRVLRPGGTMVLGTPDYGGWQWPLIEWFYGRLTPGAYACEHVTRYSLNSLREAIEQRGCKVVAHDYILRGEMILKAIKSRPNDGHVAAKLSQ